MTVTITTDHKWKSFKYSCEVPAHALAEYDHLTEGDALDGWLCYRRRWYHVSDFVRYGHLQDSQYGLTEWDGYAGDSFFSGVVLKLSNDGESYKVGTYYS